MNIRWSAVLYGWLADVSLSLLVQIACSLFGQFSFYEQPDLTQPTHVVIMALLLLATGAGGFLAARLGGEQFVMHGLLVGVVGILMNLLMSAGVAPSRMIVVAQAIGCAIGALGGYLGGLGMTPHNPSGENET